MIADVAADTPDMLWLLIPLGALALCIFFDWWKGR